MPTMSWASALSTSIGRASNDSLDMLAELREDNKILAARLREVHDVCDRHRDTATAGPD